VSRDQDHGSDCQLQCLPCLTDRHDRCDDRVGCYGDDDSGPVTTTGRRPAMAFGERWHPATLARILAREGAS